MQFPPSVFATIEAASRSALGGAQTEGIAAGLIAGSAALYTPHWSIRQLGAAGRLALFTDTAGRLRRVGALHVKTAWRTDS